MAYIINRYSGAEFTVLEDATINTATSINLLGRNYIGYGEQQNENFLWLLENFANDSAPVRPVSGQTWFNTENNNLYVYDGLNWNVVGSALPASVAPENPSVGSFWLNTNLNSLYVYTGSNWEQVGPESAEGFGVTRAHSISILATNNRRYPIIKIMIDDEVTGIIAYDTFTIDSSESITGFSTIYSGYNMSPGGKFVGDLEGSAASADRLTTSRTINGVGFNGTANITIRSGTTEPLVSGTYIAGSDYDGLTKTTWSVDATPTNSIGKVVARDSNGNFSANTIAADLVGDVTGNVTAPSGTSTFDVVRANQFIGATLSGNAFSATKLENARLINGIPFNGTTDIVVTAAAATLTGITINPNVVNSSLTLVGTLQKLKVEDAGIKIGTSEELQLNVTNSIPTIQAATETGINFTIKDSARTGGSINLRYIPSVTNLAETGVNYPTVVPNQDNVLEIGQATNKFRKIYATEFTGNLTGNADTATSSTTATNIAGGGSGSIPYQNAAGTTTFLNPIANKVLRSNAAGIPYWDDPIFEDPTKAPINSAILTGTPRSTTPPFGDNSTRIATTAYVRAELSAYNPDPFWAGATNLSNVASTYSGFPAGTRVSFWEERTYFRPANSNGGSVQISDRYRRTVRKNSNGTWSDIG